MEHLSPHRPSEDWWWWPSWEHPQWLPVLVSYGRSECCFRLDHSVLMMLTYEMGFFRELCYPARAAGRKQCFNLCLSPCWICVSWCRDGFRKWMFPETSQFDGHMQLIILGTPVSPDHFLMSCWTLPGGKRKCSDPQASRFWLCHTLCLSSSSFTLSSSCYYYAWLSKTVHFKINSIE